MNRQMSNDEMLLFMAGVCVGAGLFTILMYLRQKQMTALAVKAEREGFAKYANAIDAEYKIMVENMASVKPILHGEETAIKTKEQENKVLGTRPGYA